MRTEMYSIVRVYYAKVKIFHRQGERKINKRNTRVGAGNRELKYDKERDREKKYEYEILLEILA